MLVWYDTTEVASVGAVFAVLKEIRRIGKRGNVALVCAVWRAVAVVLSVTGQDAAFAKFVQDELLYCLYNKWRMCCVNKIKPCICIFCHTWLLYGTKGDS